MFPARHRQSSKALACLIWAVYCSEVASLVAYDCQHNRATHLALDTTSPAPCPDPKNDFDKPRVTDWQLVRTEGDYLLDSTRCQVFSTKLVTRCGFNSLSYGAK